MSNQGESKLKVKTCETDQKEVSHDCGRFEGTGSSRRKYRQASGFCQKCQRKKQTSNVGEENRVCKTKQKRPRLFDVKLGLKNIKSIWLFAVE